MIRRPPRSTPLSLHDALPISSTIFTSVSFAFKGSKLISTTVSYPPESGIDPVFRSKRPSLASQENRIDRKSTRLNSSHLVISYAVFCLKKKNNPPQKTTHPHP